MNQPVTNRAELLRAAGEIAAAEGIDALNIRRLAGKCGIAVGSVYNYFPSKGDLILGVAEEFWRTVFHEQVCETPWNMETEGIRFDDFFVDVYERLGEHLDGFKAIFLSHPELLRAADRKKGRQVEQSYFLHMQTAFAGVLDRDREIAEDVWTDAFTKEKFVSFLFNNMLSQLAGGEKDCGYLKEIIERLLYRQGQRKGD